MKYVKYGPEPAPFISYNDLVLYMEKAIADRGEGWVYPIGTAVEAGVAGAFPGMQPMTEGVPCQYTLPNGQPACAVGEILHLAGIDIEHEEDENKMSVDVLAMNYVFDTDEKGARYLSELQTQQDRGQPWGEAHRVAMLTAESTEKKKS